MQLYLLLILLFISSFVETFLLQNHYTKTYKTNKLKTVYASNLNIPHVMTRRSSITLIIPSQTSDEIPKIRSFSGNDDVFQTESNNSIKKDLNNIKNRLDSLERSILSIQSIKSKTTIVGHFVESLSASTIEINPKTVEICSIISFFFIGAIIGASLLDRLWLLGGIIGGIYASKEVNRNTKSGYIIRLIGVNLTQIIINIQEKYNQFIIFYQTGKLAYLTSRIWDKYDESLGIQKTINEMKNLTIKRAIDFNTAFTKTYIINEINDIWNIIQKIPFSLNQFNKKYEITSIIYSFTKSIYNTIEEEMIWFINKGNKNNIKYNNNNNNNKNNKNIKNNENLMYNYWKNLKNQFQFIINGQNTSKLKPSINVWGSPFNSYKKDGYKYFLSEKKLHKNNNNNKNNKNKKDIKINLNNKNNNNENNIFKKLYNNIFKIKYNNNNNQMSYYFGF